MKRKLLLLTSDGGTGQYAVCQALQQQFSTQYDIVTLNMTTDALKRDPLNYLHPKLNTEVVYNWLMRHGQYWALNLFVRMGAVLFRLGLGRQVQRQLENVFQAQQPDLIISIVPYYNRYAIMANGQRCPFYCVVCDVDIRGYFFDWHKDLDCQIYLPVCNKTQQTWLAKRDINSTQFHVAGYPLRQQFYRAAKKTNPTFTLSLMLGGQGSNKLYGYLKSLLQLKTPFRLQVFCGRNTALKEKLQRLENPHNKALQLQGFTDDIATTLAQSDLIITKTGSCSVFELLHLKIPMLLDCTSPLLFWEKANVDYLLEHGVAIALRRTQQLPALIAELNQSDSPLYARLKQNTDTLTNHNFFEHFKI